MTPKLPVGRLATALAAFVLGGAAALGQAPWNFWWLSLPALAGIFLLLRQAQCWRRAAWVGWTAGAGYFALALFWIIEPFLVDIPRHGWMAPFALVFVSTGFALFWALAFGLAHWQGGAARQMPFAVLLLCAAELARGVILTGFPWAMIGHIWTDHPVLQLAALGGAGLLTFFTLAVAALPVMVPRTAIGAVVAAALLAGGWGYGASVLVHPNAAATGKTVRLVQPNAAQHLKWDPAHAGTFFERQLAMTREPSEQQIDLIIWPETALATRLDRAEVAIDAIADAAQGVPVVFGGNDVVDGTYRNTLVSLNAQGQRAESYYKHHLVPFGEYVPLGELLAEFGITGLAARDGAGYGTGPGPRLIDIDGVGRALPLICYELIFPRHLHTAERPDFILQITNDAWFGNISGPYQHLAQAKLRAVEQGLGLVRAANTGITAAIDARGRVLRETPLNEAGYLDVALPGALPPTLYSTLRDWGIAALLLLLLIAASIVPPRLRD